MRSGISWPFLRGIVYPLCAPLVGLLFLVLSLNLGLFERTENMCVNWRFQLREPYDPAPDPRILLVKIDQPSLDAIGGWPWDRSMHGDLCQLLAAANVACVGFDILFTEPRDQKMDSYLGQSAAAPRATISGANFDPEDQTSGDVIEDWGKTQPLTQIQGDVSKIPGGNTGILPIPPLRETSLFGSVVSAPGLDGITRKLPMLARVKKRVFPSLSLQMLCQFWHIAPDQVQIRLGQEIELPTPDGSVHIPIDASGEMLLNYRQYDTNEAVVGGVGSISYAQLEGGLAQHFAQGQDLPKDIPPIENRVLLVGQTAVGLTDFGPTPLEALAPLVLVHFTALNNILRGDYLHVVPDWPVVLAWMALGWATLYYLGNKGIGRAILVPSLCVILYLAGNLELFIYRSVLLPVVWPITFFALLHAGSLLLRLLEEQESRRLVKKIFATYIAPSILEQLLANPESIKLGGTSRSVTVLFSDIRGFSSLNETMGEEELVLQLNEYFEKMVGCVNRLRGTLHKYIGDGVMAAWGDVIPDKPEIDAARAVRSALAMRAELIKLNAMWAEQGRPQLRIGIGLNHGKVLVGNIGANQRKEYTLIGDPVNLASRLEGVTKEYKTDIIMGESVYALTFDKFLTRTLGYVQVVGKTQPVKAYEVLDDLEQPVGEWSFGWVSKYEKAMEAYFDRRFSEARDIWQTCLAERPGDYCCELYLGFCGEFVAKPPPPDWDGTQIMKIK